MYPILFSVGETKVTSYAVLFFLAVVAGVFCFAIPLWIKKVKIKSPVLFVIIIYCFGLAVMAAMLWDHVAHAIAGEGFETGGISYLGGVAFGVPLFCIVMYLIYPKNTARYLINAVVPGITLGHMFGRIGCFLGGCCFGRPTQIGLGVYYPEDSMAYSVYGHVKLIPTQLYEAFFLLFLTVIFFLIIRQKRMILYGLLYGGYRFFAEYLRGDNRGAFLSFLTPAQFLSLLLVLASIVMLLIQKKRGDGGRIHRPVTEILTIVETKKRNMVILRELLLQGSKGAGYALDKGKGKEK